MSHLLKLVMLVSLVGGFAGCRSVAPPVTTSTSVRDSVEGTIAIVGTDFDHRIVLIHSDTGIAVVSQSQVDSASLARVAGLEVRLVGHRTSAQSMVVESFKVLRANKSPVVDGILQEANRQLQLVTSAGTVYVLGNPPTPLWGMKGSRIWIGGPLDRGPNVYGLITPPLP